MEKREELKSNIRKAVSGAKMWQRIPTSIAGVFLIKAPKGNDYTVMVEINPLDDEGRPIKRRGIFLMYQDHLDKFLETMSDPKVGELLDAIQDCNRRDVHEPVVSL